jgi:hypothetical protein
MGITCYVFYDLIKHKHLKLHLTKKRNMNSKIVLIQLKTKTHNSMSSFHYISLIAKCKMK